jgi:hypothetical protein
MTKDWDLETVITKLEAAGFAAVVGADNRINLKKITIGRDYGNSLEVLQGIDAGDRIVINPPDALEQNELINIAGQDAPGTAHPQSSPTSKP